MNTKEFDALLATLGIKVATHSGNTAAKGDPWKLTAYAWTVTFRRGNSTLATPFFCGTGHAKEIYGRRVPIPPTAQDVLCSLASDSDFGSRSFADFCAELGYDTDSRSALATYLECQETANELRRFLGRDYDAVCTAATE